MDEAQIGTLADRNLAATWAAVARRAGGAVGQVDMVQLAATGLPIAFFNGAYVTGRTVDPQAVVEHAVAFMAEQGVPWLLWVREGVDDAVLAAGRRAGLGEAGGPPAMVLRPIPPVPPPPDGLVITVAADAADVDAHCSLAAAAFQMPVEIARRLVDPKALADPGVGVVVGRIDGEPVATAVVSTSGTTAGVYNVATAPEHQRRGFGAALTWAAVAEGVRRGCDHAVLQSSPSGQPVYEAMGFVHLGRYVQLEGPPRR